MTGTRGDPPTLAARTTRLDAEVDPLAVAGRAGWLWERDGAGLAGRGEALRLTLPTGPGRLEEAAALVGQALSAIRSDDEVGRPGCGPVAFAALPFADDEPATVVVPALVVGRDADGTRWATRVVPAGGSAGPGRGDAPGGGDAPDPGDPSGFGGPLAAGEEPLPPPAAFHVRAGRAPAAWCEVVAAGRDAVRAGELRKVVLARDVVVEADVPFDAATLLARLRAAYPSCFLYSVDGLVGASPELLVARTGDLVRSQPMAGTVPRSGDPTTDARLAARLLASAKDRQEHQVTIDAVLDDLLPFCSYVDAEAEPAVVPMANVAHLATLVHGRLSSPPATALSLAAALHPTPAVGGAPRPAALAAIARLESLARGRYAGPVGWVDARGDGAFAVAIRCAELDGRRARLFAGVGVVGDSEPAAELAETQAKLQALLAAVVRP